MADDPLEKLSDTIRSGLTTTDLLEAAPPSLRVSWIGWDSGFRGTGLAVGDHIVAVDGVAVRPFENQQEMQRGKGRLIGQYQESSYWEERGAKDGDPLRLTVRRRRIPGAGWETLEITGALRADRFYYDANGRSAMGPGGPDRMVRDDFSDSWLGWYTKKLWDWERQLDGGIWGHRTDNRQVLARHLEDEPQVKFLVERYPGPFSAAVAADWENLRDVLAGRRYEIGPEDLAYRVAEERRVAEVTTAARAAWEAFRSDRASEIVATPASFDPFARDPAEIAGRLVALPVADVRSWVQDFGRAYVSWNEAGTWFFCPLDTPVLGRVWDAQARYKRNVAPLLGDDMALVARILPERKLISVRGRGGVAGLEVEPVAVLLGRGDQQIFVDLTIEEGGVSPFAGEAAIQPLPSSLPADDASPRQVLEALIAALYARDVETWFTLFADWQYVADPDRPWYQPYYPHPVSSRDGDWTRARRVILEKSYAVRVVWVGEPRLVARGDELPGLPPIERVSAEIEHVGLFDGEYRAFNSIEVHRHWALERRAGGPWRITTHQGI